MIRRVIQIDEEKCNGCGICVTACHEGAIGMVDGKARLMRDDYCDGLGDCLPNCPTGAISFIEREAAAYDEAAVKANMERKETHNRFLRSLKSDTLLIIDNFNVSATQDSFLSFSSKQSFFMSMPSNSVAWSKTFAAVLYWS